MRGTVPITLIQPGKTQIGPLGDRRSAPKSQARLAIRREAAGGIGPDGTLVVATYDREYDLRKAGPTPEPGWLLRDGGLTFQIVAVTESRHRGRRWKLKVKAKT